MWNKKSYLRIYYIVKVELKRAPARVDLKNVNDRDENVFLMTWFHAEKAGAPCRSVVFVWRTEIVQTLWESSESWSAPAGKQAESIFNDLNWKARDETKRKRICLATLCLNLFRCFFSACKQWMRQSCVDIYSSYAEKETAETTSAAYLPTIDNPGIVYCGI